MSWLDKIKKAIMKGQEPTVDVPKTNWSARDRLDISNNDTSVSEDSAKEESKKQLLEGDTNVSENSLKEESEKQLLEDKPDVVSNRTLNVEKSVYATKATLAYELVKEEGWAKSNAWQYLKENNKDGLLLIKKGFSKENLTASDIKNNHFIRKGEQPGDSFLNDNGIQSDIDAIVNEIKERVNEVRERISSEHKGREIYLNDKLNAIDPTLVSLKKIKHGSSKNVDRLSAFFEEEFDADKFIMDQLGARSGSKAMKENSSLPTKVTTPAPAWIPDGEVGIDYDEGMGQTDFEEFDKLTIGTTSDRRNPKKDFYKNVKSKNQLDDEEEKRGDKGR